MALAVGCGELREDDPETATLTATVTATATATATATDGAESSADDDDTSAGPKLDLGDVVDATGADVDGTTGCQQNIDIVFVMDVSTSMGPVLSTLADEIQVVDDAIAALELPGVPHYGLVVFVDDVAILNTGAPYPDVQTLRADFMQWSTFTASNSQVGGGNSNSTWPENSLDALYTAAAGFQWRPADDTLRMIIHTTDDTFWNGPTTGNGVAIARSYDEVVDTLQQASIRDFSFTSQIGGSCECEDVTPGWSTPYLGQPTIPTATDGGVFDLDLVLAGQLSLSAAIGGAIDETMCEPYEPVG